MGIEVKLTERELQIIHHALSSLGGKYRNEAKALLKANKPHEASVKDEFSNEVWDLYLKLPTD